MPESELIDKKNSTVDKYSMFLDASHEQTFESMYEINNYLIKSETKPHKIKQKICGVNTVVDLGTGKIEVNGEKIDLNIKESLLVEVSELGLRWVNFNKNRADFNSEFSLPITSKIFVIGWQGNDKAGNNVQRLVAVKQDGSWELWSKR